MSNAELAGQSRVEREQARLPIGQQVVVEATQLSERLAALERNKEPNRGVEIVARLERALFALRGGAGQTSSADTTISDSDGAETALKEACNITLKNGRKRLEALETHVLVDGQIIRAVILDGTFGMTRPATTELAVKLGGRTATRAENMAVADDLLNKLEKKSLKPAEESLLNIYRDRYVRDSDGWLAVKGRNIMGSYHLRDCGVPSVGALFVLPLQNRNKKTTGFNN